jgi:hypothetical protein
MLKGKLIAEAIRKCSLCKFCHCERSEATQSDALLKFSTGLLCYARNDGK